jgi:hypothetical protein
MHGNVIVIAIKFSEKNGGITFIPPLVQRDTENKTVETQDRRSSILELPFVLRVQPISSSKKETV